MNRQKNPGHSPAKTALAGFLMELSFLPVMRGIADGA